MNQMTRSFLAFLVFVSLASGLAFAEVNIVISDDYQAIHYAVETELQAGKRIFFHLPLNAYGDHYVVDTKTELPGIELWVLDAKDVESRNPDPTLLARQALSGEQSFRIDAPPSASGAFGVLTNESESLLKITARVRMVGKRPKEVTENIRKLFILPFEAVDVFYELPEISVFISPCAMEKIFPKPDIHICTELVADMSSKGLSKALIPIFLNELARFLHARWKLPIDIDEEIADEFAVAILATSIPESLEDLIDWLKIKDPITDAVLSILPNKEKFSQSISRARKIRKMFDNPAPAVQRWGHLLSGHERKRRITSNGRPISNVNSTIYGQLAIIDLRADTTGDCMVKQDFSF